MGMEAVKEAVVAYQGSRTAVTTREEKRPKTVSVERRPAAEGTEKNAPVSDPRKADKTEKGVTQQALNKQNTQLQKAVEEINKKMLHNSEAVFGIHEKTNRVTIKIVDKESKKVLKEIPPEETLDMIAKVWELAGIMVDEKM